MQRSNGLAATQEDVLMRSETSKYVLITQTYQEIPRHTDAYQQTPRGTKTYQLIPARIKRVRRDAQIDRRHVHSHKAATQHVPNNITKSLLGSPNSHRPLLAQKSFSLESSQKLFLAHWRFFKLTKISFTQKKLFLSHENVFQSTKAVMCCGFLIKLCFRCYFMEKSFKFAKFLRAR